jgi:NitT/TauT family transport system ATP-binding protein
MASTGATTMSDEYIVVRHLSKSYRQNTGPKGSCVEVLADFNLSIGANELVTFLGPNACGKTTLMNLIAGLVPCDSGSIEVEGKPPEETRIGYVCQNVEASLYPWKKNIDNIAFPLELQGIPKAQRTQVASELLQRFFIRIPEQAYPYQLSGGQRQLIGIERALIADPQVLILDEPFSQLDCETRLSMQSQLLKIWDLLETTVLFVSHDIDEAVLLGDRIIVLSKRPARIVSIIDNPLPRPRNHDVLQTDEFFALKKRAHQLFAEALRT